MRILHVIPTLAERDGGPPKAVIEMCRELRRRGHESPIYATNADGRGHLGVPLARAVEVGGADVTYFPVSGGNYYKLSPAMSAALRENVARFDLVHVHMLYNFPSAAAAHHCRKYGVPYVIQPHGSLDPYLYRRHRLRKRLYEALIERRNLAAAWAVVFTSEEEMRLAKLSGLRFRGAVVPLGVELEEPAAGAENAADALWPELAGKRVVLFLSRINFKKGLDVLARAFGELHRARPDAHLVIAGPDTDGYAAQVRGWLAAERALDAATFTGMVLGERKAALLARADLFVLPSYSENFGIALVEAMGAGLPIVISNRVNIWREIAAARAGLVVNPDAGEVAEAMLRLLDDPVAASAMGARGRRLAREQFSWRAAGDQLVAVYADVVARQRPAAMPDIQPELEASAAD
jgi:glycosyltransferase involved in cell wall biosynthesis